MCEVIAHAINQKFQLLMMEEQKRLSKMPLSAINLEADMQTGKEFNRDRELLRMFSGESVSVAVEMISGMAKAIEGFVKEESSKRDLKDLKTHFL